MNSFLSITIRVSSQAAEQQIIALQRQLKILAGAPAGGGGVSGWLNDLGTRMENFGKNMQWTGRQIEQRFTLPLVLAGKAAFGWAQANAAATAQLTKVYGDASMSTDKLNSDVALLSRGFRDLSDMYGINQAEVINMGAAWAATGATGGALLSAVQTTSQAMLIGNGDAVTTTKSIIALQAAWGLTSEKLKGTVDILTVIGTKSAVGFDPLLQGMIKAGAGFIAAGVDAQHGAALITTLAPAFGTATRAAQGLPSILLRIMAPTKAASDLMNEMGINTASAAWQNKNGADRLIELGFAYQKLTGPQQAVADKTLFSIFQGTKAAAVLRDLTNANGEYNKALRETSTPEKTAAEAAKQLQTQLASSPQAIAILTTQIKNLAAQAIVPMIPLFLHLLQYVVEAIHWFTNLSPAVQKAVGIFLIFLAALGPVISYVGSFITVGAQFVKMTKVMADGVGWLGRMLGIFGTETVASTTEASVAIETQTAVLVAAMETQSAALAAAVGVAVSSEAEMVAANAGTVSAEAAAYSARIAALHAFYTIELGMTATQSAELIVAAEAASEIVLGTETAQMAAMTAEESAAYSARIAGMMEFYTARVGMTETQAAAMITATMLEGEGMLAAQAAYEAAAVAEAEAGAAAIELAATGPVGLIAAGIVAATVLVVLGLTVFRTQIWDAIKSVASALEQLPGIFVTVFEGIVRIVAAAVKQVYEWLSYLNPFAKHSPSLVDDVSRGVDIIAAKYASLIGIGAIFRGAANDLQSFHNATANLTDEKYADQRANIVAQSTDPGSGAAADAVYASMQRLKVVQKQIGDEYERENAILDGWTRKINAANEALKIQNQILTELNKTASEQSNLLSQATSALSLLASTPIQGEKAMGDQIFANEMAQKALNLEMLKISDSVGGIDTVSQKLSKINGDLQLLTGTQKDLRNAGAGSDILGALNDQAKVLDKQKVGIQAQITGMTNMQLQLDHLARQGQILNLEQSLQFDPLNRQIQNASKSMAEMPFAELLAKTIAARTTVDQLTISWKAADTAAKAQQAVVDQLTVTRDRLQSSYDDEKARVDELAKSYQDVTSQITAMEQALSAAASAAGAKSKSKTDPLGAAGAGNFPAVATPAGLGTGPDLKKMIDDMEKTLNQGFASMDMTRGISDAFWRVIHWIGKEAPRIGIAILKGIAFTLFEPEILLAAAGVAVAKLAVHLSQELWKKLKPVLAGVASLVTDVLGPPFLWLWHHVIEPAFHGISVAISAAWKVIEPILKFFGQVTRAVATIFLDLFYAPLVLAWQLLQVQIKVGWAILKGIFEVFAFVVAWLWKSAVQPALAGIAWLFHWLWEHEIHPIITGAIWLFQNVLAPVFDWLWHNVVKPAFDGIATVVKWAWENVIKPTVQGLVDFFNTVLAPVFDSIWHGAVEPALNGIATLFQTVFGNIGQWIHDGIQDGINVINFLIQGVNTLSGLLPGLSFNIDKIPDLPKGGAPSNGAGAHGGVSGLGNAPVHRNTGGVVPGRGPNVDSVLAMLTTGEYVLNRGAVDAIGVDKLNQINGGFGLGPVMTPSGHPGFNKGGWNPLDTLKAIGGVVIDPLGAAAKIHMKAAALAVHEAAALAISHLAGKAYRPIANTVNDGTYTWVKKVTDPAAAYNWLNQGGIVPGSARGTHVVAGDGNQAEAIIPLDRLGQYAHKTFVFHGDLSFPNITNGDDAKAFLDNLENLAA